MNINDIGDAVDVAEGVAAETVKLTASTTQVTVKKAMKAVELTDEAVLSGYGNPIGETNNQIAKSIASKVDNDCMDALYNAQLFYDGSSSQIAYDGIVDAIDVFDEEVNTEKVMFINPKQVTKLRKDSNFISADKYGVGTNVIMTGEIGRIANTRIVPSKKVKEFSEWYSPIDGGDGNALTIVASGATAKQVNLADVTPSLPNAKVGDTVNNGVTLINGWMEGKYTGIRYVHAKGEIEAKIWHTKNKRINYNITERKETGNLENKYSFKLNNFKITFLHNPCFHYQFHDLLLKEVILYQIHQ